MTFDLPESIRHYFSAAGWYPGRRVTISSELRRAVDPGHPSIGILSQLSGLRVGDDGAGIECARTSLEFQWTSNQGSDEIAYWERTMTTRLVCVAGECNGHASLFVASDGRCFGTSHMHDAFHFCGATIGIAVERLLTGLRSRPMLRHGQPKISLYGLEFTAESPEIYHP